MNWRDTFRTATEAVRTHRLRSALTMLGILIGITAVVLTVGLGQGAKAQVHDQINELGTNLLVISPGSSTSSTGARGGFGSASTLTVAGRQRARSRSRPRPTSQAVAPVSTTSASLVNGSTNWTTTLTGTTPSWQIVRSRGVCVRPLHHRQGRASAAAVVVLGPDTASELFSGRDPVGQYGHLQRRHSSRSSACSTRSARPRTHVEQRPRGRAAEHLLATPRRRHEPQLGQLDLREGDVGDDAVGRLPGGRRAPAQRARASRTASDADFSIATQQSILSAATSVDDTLTVMLGGIAVDRAARRRHRRDEHHAGVGHRTDPRDRPAQGARRPAAPHPPPVPRRGRRSSASPAACSASGSESSARSSSPLVSRLTRDPLAPGRARPRSWWPSASAWSSASTPHRARLGSRPSTP